MKLFLVNDPSEQSVLAGEFTHGAVTLPELDWEKDVAVVVDMGEQRTGGYGVHVAGIRLAAPGEIHLICDVKKPGKGDFVVQVISHPYTVARVPRTWLQEGENTLVARDRQGAELGRMVVQR